VVYVEPGFYQEQTLLVPAAFSFTENLNYLARAPEECLFKVEHQRVYRAIPIRHATPVVEIRADTEHSLTIRFLERPASYSKEVQDDVVRYVRDWFDLDTDLQLFYDLAKGDPLLYKAVGQFYGLRTIGIPDLFEALCWGIIGQQINLPFAYTLKRRFVEAFGRHVISEGNTYWIFPSPQQIAALSVEDLVPTRMTVKKCEYIIGVAQLMAEGKLTKEQLLTGDVKEAEKKLVSIRGIGPWTAHYVLMRCLRFPNAFPIDDVGLHNAIKHVLGKEKKPTREEILQRSEAWSGWEAYATFYLWRYLY
jgi:DNA-3-methyladenine glycosylase II